MNIHPVLKILVVISSICIGGFIIWKMTVSMSGDPIPPALPAATEPQAIPPPRGMNEAEDSEDSLQDEEPLLPSSKSIRLLPGSKSSVFVPAKPQAVPVTVPTPSVIEVKTPDYIQPDEKPLLPSSKSIRLLPSSKSGLFMPAKTEENQTEE